ncbi:MAG TPA: group 1 truncated hemoglobin [Paucimonas sp.]|nr:group 1 truncated hemoglobin [Paucimonas sp.]
MTAFLKRLCAACACAFLLAAPAAAQQGGNTIDDTLYRELGGQEGIRKIIDDFKLIIMDDARINASFKDVDIAHLKKRLAEQFCALAGGPCKYGGKDMTLIHADLGITVAQFNALTEDLQQALDRNGIPYRVQNRLIAKLAPMQREIVTK